MDVLVLGGTGAMGRELVGQLLGRGFDGGCAVAVTSRSERESPDPRVRYLRGNAKDLGFLREALAPGWDAVVDFMSYSTAEFEERCGLLLDHTAQYVFISSARVYAEHEGPITEGCPRLLDACGDAEYLATDEYALAKARCEDLLEASGRYNWTVVRPSITYGPYRLQLGVLEKENWLYRALHGRSIVFSRDIGPHLTAMTTGADVARGIAALIGEPGALGERYHITSEAASTWDELLGLYLRVLEEETGSRPRVVYTERSHKLPVARYQVIYCRCFDRSFDCSKVGEFVDVDAFKDPEEGLAAALREFLREPKWRPVDWRLEAWADRAAGERTPLSEVPGAKAKVKYLLYRHGLDGVADLAGRVVRKLKALLHRR